MDVHVTCLCISRCASLPNHMCSGICGMWHMVGVFRDEVCTLCVEWCVSVSMNDVCRMRRLLATWDYQSDRTASNLFQLHCTTGSFKFSENQLSSLIILTAWSSPQPGELQDKASNVQKKGQASSEGRSRRYQHFTNIAITWYGKGWSFVALAGFGGEARREKSGQVLRNRKSTLFWESGEVLAYYSLPKLFFSWWSGLEGKDL